MEAYYLSPPFRLDIHQRLSYDRSHRLPESAAANPVGL